MLGLFLFAKEAHKALLQTDHMLEVALNYVHSWAGTQHALEYAKAIFSPAPTPASSSA